MGIFRQHKDGHAAPKRIPQSALSRIAGAHPQLTISLTPYALSILPLLLSRRPLSILSLLLSRRKTAALARHEAEHGVKRPCNRRSSAMLLVNGWVVHCRGRGLPKT